ncbi:MAG: hypothetical protein EOM77_03650 [Bacteroidia bacterium]|nr:hypothetical protein [Bacteroidia bacterium]
MAEYSQAYKDKYLSPNGTLYKDGRFTLNDGSPEASQFNSYSNGSPHYMNGKFGMTPELMSTFGSWEGFHSTPYLASVNENGLTIGCG